MWRSHIGLLLSHIINELNVRFRSVESPLRMLCSGGREDPHLGHLGLFRHALGSSVLYDASVNNLKVAGNAVWFLDGVLNGFLHRCVWLELAVLIGKCHIWWLENDWGLLLKWHGCVCLPWLRIHSLNWRVVARIWHIRLVGLDISILLYTGLHGDIGGAIVTKSAANSMLI